MLIEESYLIPTNIVLKSKLTSEEVSVINDRLLRLKSYEDNLVPHHVDNILGPIDGLLFIFKNSILKLRLMVIDDENADVVIIVKHLQHIEEFYRVITKP